MPTIGWDSARTIQYVTANPCAHLITRSSAPSTNVLSIPKRHCLENIGAEVRQTGHHPSQSLQSSTEQTGEDRERQQPALSRGRGAREAAGKASAETALPWTAGRWGNALSGDHAERPGRAKRRCTMLLVWPREGKHPDAHRLVNVQADCGLPTPRNIIQTQKGMTGRHLLPLG